MVTYPRCLGIKQLQSVLREKLWMMMSFYGDESGTHDKLGMQPGSDVVAVSGYLGWDHDWKRFEIRWRNCLNKYGVEEFHMARFRRKKELPYRKWSDAKREEFLHALIKIARRHSYIGIGGLVVLEDYNRIVPDNLKREHKHPYYFCFQMLIDLLLPELEEFDPPLPHGQKVAFIFDQNQQFADNAKTSFDVIKKLRDRRDRMGSLTFGSRTDYIPLQAADLIVYTVRDHLSRLKKGETRRDWTAALAQKKNLKIRYCSQENLQKYVELYSEGRMKQALNALK